MSSPSSMARKYFWKFNSRDLQTDFRAKSSVKSESDTAYAEGHGARVHVRLFRPYRSLLSSGMYELNWLFQFSMKTLKFPPLPVRILRFFAKKYSITFGAVRKLATYSTFIVKNGRNLQNYLVSIHTYWYIVTCHKNTSHKNINWQLFVYYLCLLSWICRKKWSIGWWVLSNFHKK